MFDQKIKWRENERWVTKYQTIAMPFWLVNAMKEGLISSGK